MDGYVLFLTLKYMILNSVSNVCGLAFTLIHSMIMNSMKMNINSFEMVLVNHTVRGSVS